MRRPILILLAVWFGLASVSVSALCRKATLEQQFALSAVVFVGRATAQEADPRARTPSMATTFTVEQMWKGAPATEVRVTTCGGVRVGDLVSSCDPSFTFRVGATYLVFASGEPLQTDDCMPTALLERASQTLAWLATQPRTAGR